MNLAKLSFPSMHRSYELRNLVEGSTGPVREQSGVPILRPTDDATLFKIESHPLDQVRPKASMGHIVPVTINGEDVDQHKPLLQRSFGQQRPILGKVCHPSATFNFYDNRGGRALDP